ncbi:tetratricopeptide repeat protein [Candidatus Clostridium radicumherbarum]|uniref:Tetratricopeptide repeat protein n=1 Tax=Candidatus Clostridium radicumherbarum TaxID=3381662 RepID=A0ABW8TLT9_9CLOT
MFRKFSMGRKIIIFAIAAAIGIGIIVYNGVSNWKIAQLKIKNSSVSGEITAANSNKEALDKEKQLSEEAANKKEEEAKKAELEKQLEEKYQTAFTDFHSKKYSTAITLADEIINADNNFYKAYSIKGIALCYSNKYIEGMKNIDKALEIKSDYGYGLFNKALALELYAHYDDALVWYDKALSVENNYIWSYYGKASIYGRKGDVPNTIKNLQTAINIDSSVKELAKEEPDFNNVRNSKEFQQLLK